VSGIDLITAWCLLLTLQTLTAMQQLQQHDKQLSWACLQ
jgi:hypothetical protein